jgi:hypothetical protein
MIEIFPYSLQRQDNFLFVLRCQYLSLTQGPMYFHICKVLSVNYVPLATGLNRNAAGCSYMFDGIVVNYSRLEKDAPFEVSRT